MRTEPGANNEACAAALAGLPGMTPTRLRAFLTDLAPAAAWKRLTNGGALPESVGRLLARGAAETAATWRRLARTIEPLAVLDRYRSLDIGVWVPYVSYPQRLATDPWAPSVLFFQGDVAALDRPTVAIVGTRHATHEGRQVAHELGAGLSEAGVSVVSGLALGIDGAAHRGALDVVFPTPPVAVVGSGLDRVYPKRHEKLWREVGQRGLLVSEAPLGAEPEAWRFPARNRIIAGLAEILVVVESHQQGGSLLTVDEALKRNVDVMAVPGSVRSPASKGTNRLLSDGAPPVCGVDDVLVALGLRGRATGRVSTAPRHPSTRENPRIPPEPGDVAVLDAVDGGRTTTNDVMLRTGMPLGTAATALTRLQLGGWLTGSNGYWQRCQAP